MFCIELHKYKNETNDQMTVYGLASRPQRGFESIKPCQKKFPMFQFIENISR